MKKGLRAEIGSSDKKSIRSASGYQTMTNVGNIPGFSVNNAINHLQTVINDFTVRDRQDDEFSRYQEINQTKDYFEASLPQGQDADLTVSGYQLDKKFENKVISPSGQPSILSKDYTSLQRPQTVKLIGRVNPANIDPSIDVKPEGVNVSDGINLIPSWDRTEHSGRGGEKRTTRTVDNMSYRERHIYEHPDRSLA